jgi:hypothetical protein
MSNLQLRRSRKKNFAAPFSALSSSFHPPRCAHYDAHRPAIYLAARITARSARCDLNNSRAASAFDKIVSSLPVRLDETLPKLVEFTQVSSQRSSATRCCLPDKTRRGENRNLPPAPKSASRSEQRTDDRTPHTEEPSTWQPRRRQPRRARRRPAPKRPRRSPRSRTSHQAVRGTANRPAVLCCRTDFAESS